MTGSHGPTSQEADYLDAAADRWDLLELVQVMQKSVESNVLLATACTNNDKIGLANALQASLNVGDLMLGLSHRLMHAGIDPADTID